MDVAPAEEESGAEFELDAMTTGGTVVPVLEAEAIEDADCNALACDSDATLLVEAAWEEADEETEPTAEEALEAIDELAAADSEEAEEETAPIAEAALEAADSLAELIALEPAFSELWPTAPTGGGRTGNVVDGLTADCVTRALFSTVYALDAPTGGEALAEMLALAALTSPEPEEAALWTLATAVGGRTGNVVDGLMPD